MAGRIKSIISNPYVLSMISKVFSVIVGFLFTIFQSRYLGPEIKGQVATVNSIVSITSIIFGLGIYHAYPYFKRNTDKDILPIFMRISLLFLVLYGGISIILALTVPMDPKYLAACIITPLLAYDGIVSYVTLIEVPNRRSVTDMSVNLFELLVLIILWIVAPPTFVIGVVVITIKDITKVLLFTFWWRKRIFVQSESIWNWIPKLIKFGFFPMLSLLMTTLNYRIDVLMLNGKVSDSSIGIYSVGVLLAERIWMIPDAMKGVMVSKIAKGQGASEVAYVVRICNTACLFIVVAIIALGKPFIDLAFGPDYNGAYQVTLVLLAGVFSMIYYKLIAAYNIAMGKQMISFILLAIGVTCNIVANLILIPILGIYGAGIASVVSYAVCSILFIIYFCRESKTSFRSMIIINKDDINRLKRRLKKDKTKENV